jgi:A/G-specific adenine glycosylase
MTSATRGVEKVSRSRRVLARKVAERSAAYYKSAGRHFPWREEREPFRLAVAEILLQKTRASAVAPTYSALILDYPSADAMAAARVRDIEEALRPLGLSKKRSSQLIAMSKVTANSGSAIFEDWRGLLRDVPGLGAYAARAIASFGRGEKVGIVDANVARIIRRVFRIRTKDPRAVVFQHIADAIAGASDDARETNFGLLDIGAAVCLPKPNCKACPFSSFCPRFGVPKRAVRPGER